MRERQAFKSFREPVDHVAPRVSASFAVTFDYFPETGLHPVLLAPTGRFIPTRQGDLSSLSAVTGQVRDLMKHDGVNRRSGPDLVGRQSGI